MIRFRLFGFPVTVEPWHWAILAFCGGALGIKDSEDLLPVLLFMAAGVVSIIIHELGHALTMRLFGGRHISIVLHGWGGYAISQGAPFSRGQHILISLAGPLLQVACGLLVLIAVIMSADTSSGAPGLEASPVYQLLSSFIYVSLFWAVLNLIPVYPMDGGQILRGILGPRRIQLTFQISIIVAIVVGLLSYRFLGTYLLPIFMVFSVVENYKALKRARNPGAW
ncbi:MAG: hypothetical protein DBX00_06960 [Verrucomicrobia bacterium]|nr:MAG: hypothetical protein DBX00_06960 [Verrucomicrobiota bacterium]RPF87745.1 MAG: hypothetical protein CBB78_009085 [Roseibacillus sp. TMED18]